MNINTASTVSGALLPGYTYADLETNPLVKDLFIAKVPNTHYLANFWLLYPEVLLVLGSSVSETGDPDQLFIFKPDPNDPSDPNKFTLSTWSWSDPSSDKPGEATFTMDAGAGFDLGSKLTLLANVDGNAFVGVYVPIVNSELVIEPPQNTLETVTGDGVSISYASDHQVLNEDTANTGSRLFPTFEAGNANIASGYGGSGGSDQLVLDSSLSNFQGGKITVKLTTDGTTALPTTGASMIALGVSTRSMAFGTTTVSGVTSILYYPSALISGTNVPYTPDVNYFGAPAGAVSSGGVSHGAGSGVTDPSNANTLPGVYLWEKGDPLGRPSSSSVTIGTLKWTDPTYRSGLSIELNSNATPGIVEALLSHISVSVVSRIGISESTAPDYTQNWDNLPSTVNATFTLKTSDPAAAATFTRIVNVQSVAESDSPSVDLVRSYRVLDEIANNNGTLVAVNFGQGSNVYLPALNGNQALINDANNDWNGGTLRVSFLQGANNWMRLGISNFSGVFTIDWNNGRKITYYESATYYGQDTVVGGASIKANEPKQSDSTGTVIGAIDQAQGGFRGSDLLIRFNDKATSSIIQTLLGSVYMGVNDPTSNNPTNNWKSAAGVKLLQVTVTDAAGNSSFDTRPIRVISSSTNDSDIMGSDANEQLLSTSQSGQSIAGLGGNDDIIGGNGNDTMLGGTGNDTLTGGEGRDVLDGEGGEDIYDLTEGSRARDTVKITPREHDDTVIGFDTSNSSIDNALSTNDVLKMASSHVLEDTLGVVTGITFGVFSKHSIVNGMLTLMDRLGRVQVISDANIRDVLSYLNLNLGQKTGVFGFAFDSDSDSKADSVIVFEYLASNDFTAVQLQGLRGDLAVGAVPGIGVIQLVDGFGPTLTGFSISTDKLTLDFNEVVASADLSGIQLQRFKGTTKVGAVGFTTSLSGSHVDLVFTKPSGWTDLGDDEYLALVPIDRTKLYVTDAAGNSQILLQSTDPGVVFTTSGNSTIDITNSQGNFSVFDLSGGNDALAGNRQNNKIDAGIGNDSIMGREGNDTLSGGLGDDSIWGGADRDWIDGGAGNDAMIGDAGNDTLEAGLGNDTLDGGDDTDRANYSDFTASNWKLDRLANGDIQLTRLDTGEVDLLRNIEELSFRDGLKKISINTYVAQQANWSNSITGTDMSDTIDTASLLAGRNSPSLRDWVNAGAGDDTILAGEGGDDIRGEAGNDLIDGGPSAWLRLLQGGPQTNTWELQNRAHYSGPSNRYAITQLKDVDGGVTGTLNQVYYTVKDLRSGSPDGTDTVFNIDALQFSDREVRLTANVWSNYWNPQLNQQDTVASGHNVEGTAYSEQLGAIDSTFTSLFAGSDRLNGGAGDDTLKGGAGADTLRGDKGNDQLDGGANREGVNTYGDPNGFNGADVAEYSGNLENYTITRADNVGGAGYTYTVSDVRGSSGDGVDTLQNIEVLRFADQQVNLEVVKSVQNVWAMVDGRWQPTQEISGVNWEGSGFDDTISSGTVDDYRDNVRAGAGNDLIQTGKNGDWIDGGEGDDTIDGGANGASGNSWQDGDEVHYEASIKRFIITQSGDQFIVRDKLDPALGGYGVDSLTNIERISFSGGTSMNLKVDFNPNAWNNNVNGTDFNDVVDTSALRNAALNANAQSTLSVRAASTSGRLVFTPDVDEPVQDGQHFVMKLGWINNGQFTAQYAQSAVLVASGGLLTSVDSINRFPAGGNNGFQLFAADANDQAVGALLDQKLLQVVSDRNWIQTGKGDDVVYAHEGGDYVLDGLGNDFYDGGANGTSTNDWENQDRVQFSGSNTRYKIEVLTYNDLTSDIKALVDASSSDRPLSIVRVSDRIPAVAGGDGVNYLINIEQIGFDNMSVDLGVHTSVWMPSVMDLNSGNGDNIQIQRNGYNGGLLDDLIDASVHDTARPSQPVNGVYSNHDHLDGGAGNDTLSGGLGADYFVGGTGNDLIDGGGNANYGANGGDGGDEARFMGKISSFVIELFRHASVADLSDVTVQKFDDKGMALSARSNAPVFVKSTMYDPEGFIVVQDLLSDAQSGQGRDVLRGIERLSFDDMSISLLPRQNVWEQAGMNSMKVRYEALEGSLFDDLITSGTGFAQSNLSGYGGNDSLVGGMGRDLLQGGAGNDTLDGGGNPEIIDGNKPQSYDWAQYNELQSQFEILQLHDENGTYFQVRHLVPDDLGGAGVDTLRNVERIEFNNSTVMLLVDTNSRNMGQDDLNYFGTLFSDTIDAGSGADWINPGQGNDTIDGGVGFDGVTYSDAFDRYEITLVKSGSNERFTYDSMDHFGLASYEEGDQVIVKDLLPSAYGGEGEDVLTNVELIVFSNFQLDLLTPSTPYALNQSSEAVNGSDGDDSLNDRSDGSGNDVLNGWGGNDWLDGGAGNDTLDGGDNSTDVNNWRNAVDIANYGNAPRSRFDVIALPDHQFKVVDYASILDLTAADFGADGHLLATVYTHADRVSKAVGYGVDTLVNMEHLNFQDTRLSLINQVNTWNNGQYTDPNSGVHDLLQTNINGTFMSDVIVGTDHRDWIEGGAGNDTIDGGVNDPSMGNDWRNLDEVRYQGSINRYVITPTWVRIEGGTYTQVSQAEALDLGVVRGLVIEDRFDAVIGGVGKDLVVNMEQISFGNGDRILLSPEINSWHDSYTQTDNLNINGTQFNDVLGSAFNSGNDYLRGNAGDDLLIGGTGGDELNGGVGNDTLIGGDNAAPDMNGWIRTDVARYEAVFSRFEISNVSVDGKTWLQVKDKLPATAAEYLGVDLLDGIESLSFNDRWVDVAVRTNSWSDMQGYTTLNFEGTVFNDLINGPSSSSSETSTGLLRYSMRGNTGNDVLVGGNQGDDFQGGEGLDVIDGAGNGTSGDTWRDQDIARFSGDLARYDRFNISVSHTDETQGALWVDQKKVADIVGHTLTFSGAVLNDDAKSVLSLAAANLNLLDGQHDAAVLVQDKIDSAYGGDATDLVFNVETLQFRDTSIDSAVSVQTYDWNNDGKLDWVNVRGTNADDHVDVAQLVALSGKSAEELSGGSNQLELRDGNDIYIGGVGGSNILTGKGHDYVDGGSSTAKDSWGNDSRDEVRFEGNFSRYVLIDVLLRKSGDTWTVSSSKDSSLSYAVINGQGTVSSESAIINKLDKSGIALGLDRLIALHPDASTVSAWMVADRLPAELEGSGVDVLTRVDAISFNDRWMPLSLQVWLNRSWNPDLANVPYELRPVVGSGVEGTTMSEQIGVDFGNVDDYNFAGDDWIRAGAGDDTIMAGDGGDGIQGDAGNDLIDGGNNGIDDWGNVRGDSVNYDASFDTYTLRSNEDGSLTVTDSRSDGTGVDTLRHIEYISFQDRWIRLSVDRWVGRDLKNVVTQVNFNGSMLGDLIDASQDEYSSTQHYIQGNEGDDTLIGGDGPDQLEGGQGDDRIIGGSNGRDSWGNPGVDTVRFQGSINRFVIEYSNDGKNWSLTKPASGDLMVRVSDKIASDDGGLGIDTISGAEALSFSDAYITLQTARNLVDLNGDGRPDAMQVIGTAGNDLLVGDYTNDQLIGNAGNDTLQGGQGADILKGGDGDDTLDGGANGVDASGNVAPDVAEFVGKWSDYSISSTSGGRIQVQANSNGDAKADGTDTLSGIEALQFSDVYVRLQGSSTPSDTNGDGLVDLYTLVGTDLDTPDQLAPYLNDVSNAKYVIVGGMGNDELTGAAGDDVFAGGAGNDRLTGNSGIDRAKYAGKIADYAIAYSDDGVDWSQGTPFNPEGWVKVTHNVNTAFNDGVDILSGIEELVFSDKLLHLGQNQVLSKSVDANGDGNADTIYWTGTVGNDLINGNASLVNQMNGDTGNDTLMGGSAADVFRPGAGNDEVWGGTNLSQAVHDQVVIEGKRADFKVSNQQVHTVTLHEVVSGQTVTLTIGGETFTHAVTSGDTASSVAQALAQAVQSEFKINATPVSTTAGTTLKVDTNAGAPDIEKGMHLKFSDGNVYQIQSISSQDKTGGGKSWTLELDSSFAKAPTESVSVLRTGDDFSATAVGASIEIKTSNALFSVQGALATFDISTNRYTEILSKTGELDKLHGIDELVFDDAQLNLLPTSATSLSIVGGRPQSVFKVTGTDMADFMLSTNANEIFTGGLGSDQYVIASGNGKDVLRDFMAGVGGDVLSVNLSDAELTGLNGAGITDVDGLLARGIQQGNDVLFNLGANNAITLIGVAKADLVSANFEFVHGH